MHRTEQTCSEFLLSCRGRDAWLLYATWHQADDLIPRLQLGFAHQRKAIPFSSPWVLPAGQLPGMRGLSSAET